MYNKHKVFIMRKSSSFQLTRSRLFLLGIINASLLSLLMLYFIFTHTPDQTYCETHQLQFDTQLEFTMPSLLVRTYDDPLIVNYAENEPITSHHTIKSITASPSEQRLGYQTYTIQILTSGAGYYEQSGSTTKNMSQTFFSSPVLYDAYTGQKIPLLATDEVHQFVGALNVIHQGKSYALTAEQKDTWQFLDHVQETPIRKAAPSLVQTTITVEAPDDYDGLLLGFSPVTQITINTKQHTPRPSYILEDYTPTVSKLFKVTPTAQ